MTSSSSMLPSPRASAAGGSRTGSAWPAEPPYPPRHGLRACITGWLLIVACLVLGAEAQERRVGVPSGWRLVQRLKANPDQRAKVEARLECQLVSLENASYVISGQRLQVNQLVCPDEKNAEMAQEAILKLKADPAFCLRDGPLVVEFLAPGVALAKRAAIQLGFRPRLDAPTYRVRMEVAPVEKCDYMAVNGLFNLLVTQDRNPSEETLGALRKTVERFTFGTELVIRTPAADAPFSCVPRPRRRETRAGGDLTVLHFEDLPTRHGIPYVTITMRVSPPGLPVAVPEAGRGVALTRATEFWPVEDPDIVMLARSVTRKKHSPRDQAVAILSWLTPGKNIHMSRRSRGTRWGVDKVLRDRYGRCWDFADVCVSLLRAMGIPSRQVAGWLYGATGHVWVEIYLEEKGWRQVDPSSGRLLPCDPFYVPFFTTETGHMPIVYVSVPEVELVEDEAGP